jgi:hypothetical protein
MGLATFAIAFVPTCIGLWIRLGILDMPVFQQLLDTNKIEKAPIIEVCKKQPREIILSALLRTSEQAPFYIFTAFIFAYAVGALHMSRDLIKATLAQNQVLKMYWSRGDNSSRRSKSFASSRLARAITRYSICERWAPT